MEPLPTDAEARLEPDDAWAEARLAQVTDKVAQGVSIGVPPDGRTVGRDAASAAVVVADDVPAVLKSATRFRVCVDPPRLVAGVEGEGRDQPHVRLRVEVLVQQAVHLAVVVAALGEAHGVEGDGPDGNARGRGVPLLQLVRSNEQTLRRVHLPSVDEQPQDVPVPPDLGLREAGGRRRRTHGQLDGGDLLDRLGAVQFQAEPNAPRCCARRYTQTPLLEGPALPCSCPRLEQRPRSPHPGQRVTCLCQDYGGEHRSVDGLLGGGRQRQRRLACARPLGEVSLHADTHTRNRPEGVAREIPPGLAGSPAQCDCLHPRPVGLQRRVPVCARCELPSLSVGEDDEPSSDQALGALGVPGIDTDLVLGAAPEPGLEIDDLRCAPAIGRAVRPVLVTVHQQDVVVVDGDLQAGRGQGLCGKGEAAPEVHLAVVGLKRVRMPDPLGVPGRLRRRLGDDRAAADLSHGHVVQVEPVRGPRRSHETNPRRGGPARGPEGEAERLPRGRCGGETLWEHGQRLAVRSGKADNRPRLTPRAAADVPGHREDAEERQIDVERLPPASVTRVEGVASGVWILGRGRCVLRVGARGPAVGAPIGQDLRPAVDQLLAGPGQECDEADGDTCSGGVERVEADAMDRARPLLVLVQPNPQVPEAAVARERMLRLLGIGHAFPRVAEKQLAVPLRVAADADDHLGVVVGLDIEHGREQLAVVARHAVDTVLDAGRLPVRRSPAQEVLVERPHECLGAPDGGCGQQDDGQEECKQVFHGLRG